MNTQKIMNWELESSRLTMFFSSTIDYKNQGWWKSVTGIDPESTTYRNQTGDYVEDGLFGDQRLTMVVNTIQNRVDWILYPSLVSVQDTPAIGSYIDCSRTLSRILTEWITTVATNVIRVAHGFVLIKENSDNDPSYKSIQELLPIVSFDLDNWSDFEFRVNNKKDSKVLAGTQLNAISKWNPIKLVRFELNSASVQSEIYATRLELDLSSGAQNTNSFSPDLILKLSDELLEVSDRYVSEGFHK